MARAKFVTKVCEKCGKASKVRPRERRCKRDDVNAMGKSGFWCYGHLKLVAKPVATKSTADAGALEARLSREMSEIDAGLSRIRKTLSAIGRWQRRAKSTQRRILQRDHPELVPDPKARIKKTRKIALPSDE